MAGWFTNDEPLTLFTRDDVGALYHREEILRQRDLGSLPRLRVDPWIAKVLPAGSHFHLAPTRGPLHRVHDCEYRPYFTKELFAFHELCRPLKEPPRPARRPLPSVDRVRENLLARVGTRYLFGGSAAEGSPAQERLLLEHGLFRAEDRDDPDLSRLMRSAGIDCSGLFNEATEYHFFGDSKDVYAFFAEHLVTVPDLAANDPERIAVLLRPLDVLLQLGHMMMALGDGTVIQAVGDGTNAVTFCAETGHGGDPMEKYDRVVIDDAVPILQALMHRQGRRITGDFRFDGGHFMILRIFP